MAKYAELIDDFELEKRIRTIPEDMDLSEYIKQRGGVDYPEEEKADGGTVGIEILFEKKKDGGRVGFQSGGAQFTSGGNISPGTDKKGNVRNDNPFTGGGGDDGPKGPPSITNPYIGDVIEKAIIKKFEDKIPKPDNDPFKLLKGYSKTLPGQSNRFPPMFRTDTTPYASKNLLNAALTELNLDYPNLNFTDEYGFYNTENIKTAVDNAVLEGDISPIEGLNITKSITTQGDPSAIGLSYDNSLLNFATPDIGEGNYKGGIGVNLSDYADVPNTYISGNFDVTDDKLSKRDLGIDFGDGTLKLDQTTYPGIDYQKNVVDLNKDFNLANNLNLNLTGNIENYKSDGSTFRTDKSLTPTLTYTGGVGDGNFTLTGSKEIMEGGSYPNVSFSGSYPIDQKTYIDADGPQTMDKGVISLKGSDLLSNDRSAVLGYDKTIGEIGDNFYLDAGGQIDLTNPDNYAAMLKLKKTFKDGGRVGLFMGGDPLTGQALAIYNSMKAYGNDDQTIADKLQSLGYYDPNASTTSPSPSPSPGIPSAQANNFSPFNPDPNRIQSFRKDPRVGGAFEAYQRNQGLKAMGIEDPFADEISLQGAYYGDMPDVDLSPGKQTLGGKIKSGIGQVMNYPLVKGLSMMTPFGFAKQGLNALKGLMPINQRAIAENVAGNMGIAVDDIGRVVNTGNYQDPNNVMAGYNLNKMTDETFDKRIDTISGTLSEKYGLSAPQIQGIIEGTLTDEELADINARAIMPGTTQTTNLIKQIRSINIAKDKNKFIQDIAQKEAERQRVEKERKEAFAQAERDKIKYADIEAAISRGDRVDDRDRPSSGPTAVGAGMGVDGGYATDFGFLKDGGLATMFTRRR